MRNGANSDGKRSPGMSRRAFFAASAAGVAALAARRAKRRKPNVLFFLADDMGWMDSGVYGSRYYDTPNVDRLAKRSMRFTSAYSSSPLCSPTRASIMTGKHPARLGFTTPAGHLPPREGLPIFPESGPPHQPVLCPESKRFLPLEEYTLAEAMRDAGYRTGFIGKWHLGHPEKYWPPAQGFEVNIGGGRWPGPPSYHSPYRISTLPDGPDGEYLTDRLTDEAVRYIDDHRDEPFFLCMWQYAVHAPYQGRQDLIEAHTGRVDPTGRQNNPVMAAMLKSMDNSLGRILDKLEQDGIADDTIIIFFSDNGGNEYDRVGPEAWLPTNNDPLRSGKGSLYEGGTRVPMMVYWPGVVRPGSVCDEVVCSTDLHLTVLDMVGITPRAGQAPDGDSLVPLLRELASLGERPVFWHMPHRVGAPTGKLCQPATTVRQGKWKLMRVYETCEEFPAPYELYDLENDIGETRNLAESMPEKVAQLDKLITQFLKRTNAAVPKPNPAYDPDAVAVVQGWTPTNQTALALKDGALVVKCLGGDPYIQNRDVPGATGKLRVSMRLKSTSKGEGLVFWTAGNVRPFARERRMPFKPIHDGTMREYAVEFTPNGALTALRIDPCTAPGTVTFEWIRLTQADGTTLKEWRFGE